MDTRRLLKRISWAVIGLAFIVLICLNVFQSRQIKKLDSGFTEQVSQNSASADDQAAGSVNAAQKTAHFSKSGAVSEIEEVEDLNYHLQAAEDELDMVHEDLNKEMDRKAEVARLRRESQEKYRQSPGYKSSARKSIASRNEGFFEAFNISPEDAEAFNDILLAEQIANSEFYWEAEGITNPTEADRARYEQLQEEMRATYETQKIDLLGEAVYEEYGPYQSKWYIEEYRVGGFSESLDSNEKLTDTQRTALVDALAEAQEARREENAAEIDEAENTYRFPSEDFNEAGIERMVENMTSRNEASVEAARGVLTPSQIEKLEAQLDQALDRYITRMKATGMEYYGYTYDQEDDTEAQEEDEE